MSDKKHLDEDSCAELVAYLDGELQGEAARSIEARLRQDKTTRAEADSLKRTWDLLDFLPRPEPSSSFTNRTMDRVTPYRTEAGALNRWQRWRMRLIGAAWAIALMAAAVGGYYTYQAVTYRPPGDAELIRDLRLIENKRWYDVGDSVDFLNKLDQSELFIEERFSP